MNIQSTKYALSVCLSLILVVCLVYFSNITFSEFSAALTAISLAEAFALLACTAAFVFLSSVKWRMVMRRVGHGSPRLDGWGPYIYYTSLGAALSVVLTVHLSVAVARAFGARFHLKQSPVMGAGASVYEQMFDVVVLVLFAVAAACAFVFDVHSWGWVLAAAGTFAVAGAGIFCLAAQGHRLLADFSQFLAKFFGKFGAAADYFAKDQSRELFEPVFLLQVLGISIIRYLVLVLRALLVLWAAQIPIASGDFLNVFPIVQLSNLVGITPGGLGISEWTWSGILTWLGYSVGIAVQFALANRVVNSLSLVAFFVCVATTSLGIRRMKGPKVRGFNRTPG